MVSRAACRALARGTQEDPLLTLLYARQRYRDPALLHGVLVNERQVAKLCHFPSVQKFLKGETRTSHCGRCRGAVLVCPTSLLCRQHRLGGGQPGVQPHGAHGA